MERTWKQPTNETGHTTILTPGSRVVPTPTHRPPMMEPRQPSEAIVGGPSRLPQTRKHKKTFAPINAHSKSPLEEDQEDEQEDEYMEEGDAEEANENLLHYVRPRRADA